jgi:hypothetical protein
LHNNFNVAHCVLLPELQIIRGRSAAETNRG